jgi:hypothetical protein
MKLIDKSALAAEIKRLIDRSEYSEVYDYAFRDGNNAVCVHILHFLDTLETKEVDLDRAIDKWICDDAITHEDCSISDVISTAKHFFELGLKAQKGE